MATEAAALAGKLASAPAFALGLQGVLREMDRAARGLDRQETGPPTQQSERNALARLQQMQEALKREEGSPPDGQQQNPPGQNNQPPPSDAIERLAELKLLKLMQQEIHRRTIELEEARSAHGDLDRRAGGIAPATGRRTRPLGDDDRGTERPRRRGGQRCSEGDEEMNARTCAAAEEARLFPKSRASEACPYARRTRQVWSLILPACCLALCGWLTASSLGAAEAASAPAAAKPSTDEMLRDSLDNELLKDLDIPARPEAAPPPAAKPADRPARAAPISTSNCWNNWRRAKTSARSLPIRWSRLAAGCGWPRN